MTEKMQSVILHAVILFFVILTLIPFIFTINNSLRTNSENYQRIFGFPQGVSGMVASGWAMLTGNEDRTFTVFDVEESVERELGPQAAFAQYWDTASRGYRQAWENMRRYFINSFIMVIGVVVGTLFSASVAAYVLSRYRFPGHRFLFYYVIAGLMFPGVLTFVPLFMLVRQMGMLNTYWVLIIPLIGVGQVFGVYIFKTFFDGLPEDLFESARIDGAGHVQMYWNLVVPLSKPVISVVVITTTFGTWNNFLWPFVTITDSDMHPVASGLYVMATSSVAQNLATMYGAYVFSSIPLLVLFIYATKPFIEGMTSGAFKA